LLALAFLNAPPALPRQHTWFRAASATSLGGLRLESQHGLPSGFTQRFTYIDKPPTAYRSGIESSTSLDDEPDFAARSIFRVEGFRSVHSMPLLDEHGQPIGMVSTLHKNAGARGSGTQATELRAVARQSTAWLDWYYRTVVLGALEHLYNAA
jgi:hypothetical protein